MKKLIILAIFSVLLCFSHGQDEIVPEPPSTSNQTTAVPINPTTSSSTETPTTHPTKPTSPPTTPTSPTTTPTSSPRTPTSPPTTPTSPPTNPTTPPTTHAPPPTTSTVPAPTNKPTPKPKPEVNTWVANYTGTNVICIVLKMKLEIQVPYVVKDNKVANATLYVPTTAQATGNCVVNATEQNITLTWKETANISDSVTFNFKKNDTTNKFMLHFLQANIYPDATNFPNASTNNLIVVEHDKDEFLTPVAMSYRCKQDEYFSFAKNISGKFVISNLQVQAFRNKQSKDFDSAKDCETGETPGIVPIAVGCSLAALIIIVLIAYLVGRRRSQARGYLSMFSQQQREAEYIPMKNISCFGK